MRRVGGIGLAVVTMMLALYWMYYAGVSIFQTLAFSSFHLGGPLSSAGGPRPDTYDKSAHFYYAILFLAPVVASGGIAYCLFVDGAFRRRSIIYGFLLAILLPLNLLNYSQGDLILGTSVQAGLNLITIFLGLVIGTSIWSVPASATDTRVAKGMTVALLLGSAVIAPALFTFLWALVVIGAIDKAEANSVTWQQITGASGLVAAVLAVFKHVQDMRKEARSTKEAA